MLRNGLEARTSIYGEGMVKSGFMDIAVSVMTVFTVDGVKYHVSHRWRLSRLSRLIFTLF
jgi:hypothetical protein